MSLQLHVDADFFIMLCWVIFRCFWIHSYLFLPAWSNIRFSNLTAKWKPKTFLKYVQDTTFGPLNDNPKWVWLSQDKLLISQTFLFIHLTLTGFSGRKLFYLIGLNCLAWQNICLNIMWFQVRKLHKNSVQLEHVLRMLRCLTYTAMNCKPTPIWVKYKECIKSWLSIDSCPVTLLSGKSCKGFMFICLHQNCI